MIDPSVPPHDGWFSFENVPLKWHYPVGLLYDLFSGANPSQGPTYRGREEYQPGEASNVLPWRLTLHFSVWPADQLVRLDAEGKVLHDAFINAVKEADFLRNGTAKGIMSLSKSDSTQLWKSVEKCEPSRSFVSQWAFADITKMILHPSIPSARSCCMPKALLYVMCRYGYISHHRHRNQNLPLAI